MRCLLGNVKPSTQNDIPEYGVSSQCDSIIWKRIKSAVKQFL